MSSRWKHAHTSSCATIAALIVACALAVPLLAAAAAMERVDVRGNSVFSDGAIRDMLEAGGTGKGVKRVQSAYIRRGYLLATIRTETIPDDSTLVVRIDEGEPARIRAVDVHGMENVTEDRLRSVLDVRIGDRFNPEALELGVGRVLELYDGSGFPFAQVWIDSLGLDFDVNAVDLSINVVEGSSQGISRIKFDGLEHTREDLAVKLSGLRPGQRYNGERLRESHLRLSSSGVFESVSYPEVRISPDGGGVEVLIGVVEPNKTNSFSAAVGYADREGEGDRVLSGFFNLDLANIGGSLRDLAVNWRNDGKGRSETALEFKERFFFGKRMSMGVKLEQIGQDTLYTWQSVGVESAAPIGRVWGGIFGVNVAVHGDRNTFSEGPQASTKRARMIGGVSFIEGREGRGMYVEFRTRQAYAHKWIRMRDDNPGETVSQFISEISAAGTAGVTRHMHGYVEVNYKGLESGEEFVPLSEQFYVGGAATIRGYRENQFHGRRTAYARSELRLGASAYENAYLFVDGGYVLQEFRTPEGDVSNPEVFPVGYGFGLRTQSRLGNIDLSFGVGDKLSLRQTKVHVILNRSF